MARSLVAFPADFSTIGPSQTAGTMSDKVQDNVGSRGEDWFLAELGQEDIRLAPLLEWLDATWQEGTGDQAGTSAELLQETLKELIDEWEDWAFVVMA